MHNPEETKKAIENILRNIPGERMQWRQTKVLVSDIRREYKEKLDFLKNCEEDLASKSDKSVHGNAKTAVFSNLSDELTHIIEKIRRDVAEYEVMLSAEDALQESNRNCYKQFMNDLAEKFRRGPEMFSDKNLTDEILAIKTSVLEKEKNLEQELKAQSLACSTLYSFAPEADDEYNIRFNEMLAEISNMETFIDSLERDIHSEKGRVLKLREELKKISDGSM